MSSTESNFSLTVKVAGDLFTIRGEDWPSFKQHLDSAFFELGKVAEVVAQAHAVGNAVPVINTGAAPAAPTLPAAPANTWEQQGPPPAWTQPTPPAPATPQGVQQQGANPQCIHGVKVYKTGQGQKGPWKAWMCPAPKGDPTQCSPEWIR